MVPIFILILNLFAIITIQPVHASPKSLYICAEHWTSEFEAWDIGFGGVASYQATYTLAYTSDPAGIAIDESSNMLFVTSEFSTGIEYFDATTFVTIGYLGSPTIPSDLAGIEVDDENNIVYTVGRWTDDLYVLDWDPSTSTLTLRTGYPINLLGCAGAFGIALDEDAGILWVADSADGVARAYSISTWTEDASLSFTPSHQPVDITVDRVRGFVYTVSMDAGAYVPSGCGSFLISKWDGTTETTYNLGHQGVGIAVDEDTGFVYVTGSPTGTPPYDNLEVYDPSATPWTQVQQTSDIGDPAGLCIPQEEIGYNELNLAKDDGVVGCVNPNDIITYTISFDNTNNPTKDVHNVVVTDHLPPEVEYQSATGPETYHSGTHTVTWNVGTLAGGATTTTYQLYVKVKSGTTPGTDLDNVVDIIADEVKRKTVHEHTDVCTLAATIESCNSAGVKKDKFALTEDVYVVGSGYTPSTTYDAYIVDDVTWTDGMAIPPRVPGTASTIDSDPAGVVPPTLVWGLPLILGKYDIVVDVNGNGVYDEGVDALDDMDVTTAGFFVIPEFPLGTITGLASCLAALGFVFASKHRNLIRM